VIDADVDGHNAFNPLVDRAVRLFTFLGQVQLLKSPRVADLEAYRRDGAVHWLHEVPEHPAVRTARRGGNSHPSDPVLTIERVARLDPPTPDDELLAWIDGAFDNPHREPVLRDARYLHQDSAQQSDADDPPRQTRIALEDHPHIRQAHAQYLAGWRAWAEQDRRDERVRAVYGELFSTYVKSTAHPEELELVLGTGLLGWAPDGHPKVRRHLLTAAVRLMFDDDSGQLTVLADETAEGARVELEMLDPGLIRHPQHVNAIRERARAQLAHPLDEDVMGEHARRLVHTLSPDAEYRTEDVPPRRPHTPSPPSRRRCCCAAAPSKA
jgi:hypothetical protein